MNTGVRCRVLVTREVEIVASNPGAIRAAIAVLRRNERNLIKDRGTLLFAGFAPTGGTYSADYTGQTTIETVKETESKPKKRRGKS